MKDATLSGAFSASILPPIPWAHAPVTPLPDVIEDNSAAAWELFDAAQRARDPGPAARPDIQPPEGSK